MLSYSVRKSSLVLTHFIVSTINFSWEFTLSSARTVRYRQYVIERYSPIISTSVSETGPRYSLREEEVTNELVSSRRKYEMDAPERLRFPAMLPAISVGLGHLPRRCQRPILISGGSAGAMPIDHPRVKRGPTERDRRARGSHPAVRTSGRNSGGLVVLSLRYRYVSVAGIGASVFDGENPQIRQGLPVDGVTEASRRRTRSQSAEPSVRSSPDAVPAVGSVPSSVISDPSVPRPRRAA